MGGSSSPKPDKNMGRAAMKSARTGERMLTWMQEQAEITNAWADEDRSRYTDTFIPLQDQFIEEAQNYDTLERRNSEAQQAVADVQQASSGQQAAMDRNMRARGIDPRSGAAASARERSGVDTALAMAGAGNMARRNTEATGRGLRADAINMGTGLGVNPATSMSISNNAASSGFNGAMSGYGQQASILNADHQARTQAWSNNMNTMFGVASGLGQVGGALFSSEDMKTDKKKVGRGMSLKAVEKMPVEEWTYKKGVADEGRHVGPYAEDFKEATGRGDGKSIPIVDAIGLVTGAIQDLNSEVKDLKKASGRGMRMAA